MIFRVLFSGAMAVCVGAAMQAPQFRAGVDLVHLSLDAKQGAATAVRDSRFTVR